jgi:hypothetical protein
MFVDVRTVKAIRRDRAPPVFPAIAGDARGQLCVLTIAGSAGCPLKVE